MARYPAIPSAPWTNKQRKNAVIMEQTQAPLRGPEGPIDFGERKRIARERWKGSPRRPSVWEEMIHERKLKLNQMNQAQLGGGPVRQQNKQAKRMKELQKGRGIVSKGRNVGGDSFLDRQYQQATPKKSPDTYKTGRQFGMPRLKGPIGKLPIVGALPTPSRVQQIAGDMGSPLLSPRDKMLRFMLGGTNELASPAQEWRAKGGL